MKQLSAWSLILFLVFAAIACNAKTNLAPPSKSAIQDKATLISDANSFALDLYGRLKAKPGNVMISPFSLSAAMGMVYAGAAGSTEQQIRDKMFSLESARMHPAFGALLYEINSGEQRNYELITANAVWAQKGYSFKSEYMNTLKKSYAANLDGKLDFAKATEEARKEINRWAGEKTAQKIKELIGAGILNDQTRLVLTNAIYFKGEWTSQFDKKLTLNMPFTTTVGVQVQTPMMQQETEFRYFHELQRDYQVLEMPYKGKELAMVLVLPDDKDGLPRIERRLNIGMVNRWMGELTETKVLVYLPKFNLSSSLYLKDTLKEMGIKDAFDTQAADFSKMTGKKELCLTEVIQKACLEVSEEGTVAAAASGAVMGLKSMPAPSPVFKADHPFLFFIKDNRSGAILFMGRVSNPAQ